MIAAIAITVLGLLLGIAVVERTGLRMAGVIVVPLLAVYSLYSIVALPLFVLSVAIAYLGVGLIRRYTLIYGRQLLLASLMVGAIVPLASTGLFGQWTVFGSAAETVFVGTILPGIAAYNVFKLDAGDRLTDIALSTGVLGGLIVFGAMIVNQLFVTSLPPSATSILFTPAADVAQFNDAVRGTSPPTSFPPREVALVLMLVGLVISEGAHARWGVRTGGLIAIPLLVVLSLTNAWAIPVYVIGLVTVYASITLIQRWTLVYGRVLLSLGLVVSMTYAFAVTTLLGHVTGYLLYFTAILSGIGAYNYHMVAPAERPVSVALSAGLFALLLSTARVIVEPASIGVLSTVSAVEVSMLVGLVAAAGYAAYRLEERRYRVARHHSRGVIL